MNSPYYITEIDHDGSYSVFNSQLVWPHGMTIVGNIVYVTSNVGAQGGIVGLDLETGEKIYEHISPGWYNGVYSNLTADTSGNIYFGAFNRIYRLDLSVDQSYMLPYSFNIPNGICFDARNNQVLIPCEVWGTTIYAIDAFDYSMESITVDFGRYSCITEDQMGNFYISAFWEGEIFRFDNTLANRELLASGFSGPEAIHFNKLHSTLAVPNLQANRIDFLPMDIDLWSTFSSTIDWAPFAVSFEGASIYEIGDWYWDFGDGHTATIPTPTHEYETPGLYDVTLRAITTDTDTLTRVYPRHILCLADTMRTEDIMATQRDDLEVIIRAHISIPFQEIKLPVKYSGELDLVIDSFSTFGCFTNGFEGISIIDDNPGSKEITFSLKPRADGSPLYTSPNSGSVIKLYFQAPNAKRNQQTVIDFEGYGGGFEPLIIANGVTYGPIINNGLMEYLYTCGDIEGDGVVDILDIVFLIDWKFKDGSPPDVMESADVNNDGAVDILDIVHLIDWKFKECPPGAGQGTCPPPDCP
jgi:hypothetical protein